MQVPKGQCDFSEIEAVNRKKREIHTNSLSHSLPHCGPLWAMYTEAVGQLSLSKGQIGHRHNGASCSGKGIYTDRLQSMEGEWKYLNSLLSALIAVVATIRASQGS